MPKLTIGGKEYTLRTPEGKEFMSIGTAEKGNVLLSKIAVLQNDFLNSLFDGEVGEKEALFHKAWLEFVALVFVEPTESLEYDSLGESEVEGIRDFFIGALASAAPKLKKRMEDFQGSSADQSPKPTSTTTTK